MGPLLSRLRSILWRVLVVALLVWWVASDGPLVAPAMWVLFGYLLWRAAPSVVEDVRRLNAKGFRLPRFRDRGLKGQGLL